MMTFEDLYKMLSKGESSENIRAELFSSVSNDIRETHLGGENLDFKLMSKILKDNGFDLEQLPYESNWRGHKYWDIKLNNTTITVGGSEKGRGPSIRYFEDGGAHNWYVSFLDPEKFMDSIREADERYPEILRVWESFEKEIRKFQKIRELSENSIDTIIREKLRGTGIQYNLTMNPTHVLLKVKMKRRRYFEVKLPHNGFSDILTDDFVEGINKVATLLNSIKYNCKIQRYGDDINWFKSE